MGKLVMRFMCHKAGRDATLGIAAEGLHKGIGKALETPVQGHKGHRQEMTIHRLPARFIDHRTLDKAGEGGERVVYTSAQYPDIVFKQQKPGKTRDLKRFALKSVLLKYWPGYANLAVALEYNTYLDMCLNDPQILEALPIANVYGFVSSDIGLLQVSEKISLDGAGLGPSLRNLSQQGRFGEEDAAALSVFASRLLHSNMPAHDLSGRNIVKGRDVDGGIRFALIDGLGDKKLIPVRKYSRKVRHAHLVRSFLRLGAVGLDFDPETFVFTVAPRN